MTKKKKKKKKKIMSFNFSVIPIRWLLTVDSEIAFFLFHSLAEGVLVFF